MVQCSLKSLDTAFAALSDATRRGVLERLARSEASISDLAISFSMSLTGMKKHVGVLESAGLVATEKVGRVRLCRLEPYGYEAELAFLERHRRLWAARFESLEVVVHDLKAKGAQDDGS